MGKRQLGELQPFELAITLVASELVCIPMADATIPILYGIIPVFSLFLVHIIITKLATKSVKFRKFLNGKPVIIIEKGNILPDVMKDLNMNIDDIMEALRGAGYFNPSEVEYAILETNGSMTVLPKSQNKPLSPEDLGMNLPPAEIPVTVIMEGEFVGENVAQLENEMKSRVLVLLDRLSIKQQDILVLLVAGEDVFIQPYKGDFMTATLDSDEAAETTISVPSDEASEHCVEIEGESPIKTELREAPEQAVFVKSDEAEKSTDEQIEDTCLSDESDSIDENGRTDGQSPNLQTDEVRGEDEQ